MFKSILNFFYPKSCCICNLYGYYICPTCKKLFKRNLPECYVCRRLSPGYRTHAKCKNIYLYDSVFVAWEYNQVCSRVLKQYKYKNVFDISKTLSELFISSILESSFKENLKDTLLVPVPTSFLRTNERGFNQMESITQAIGRTLGLAVCSNFLGCNYTSVHQASKSKEERANNRKDLFYIKHYINLDKYKSITIVDDVITTGTTLNTISLLIRKEINQSIPLNALCLFRGKPNYLTT